MIDCVYRCPGGVASNGAAAVGGADASASNQADYSPQWAEYYRSLGKIKEAEAIEAQMKQKVNKYSQNLSNPLSKYTIHRNQLKFNELWKASCHRLITSRYRE